LLLFHVIFFVYRVLHVRIKRAYLGMGQNIFR
jgi:hypothetical protein